MLPSTDAGGRVEFFPDCPCCGSQSGSGDRSSGSDGGSGSAGSGGSGSGSVSCTGWYCCEETGEVYYAADCYERDAIQCALSSS